MPASSNYTLIRLMRGSYKDTSAWKPEIAEPMLDLETGTLTFGNNGATFGGQNLNTVTTRTLESPVDLNDQVDWGRYYIEGDVINLPQDINSPGKFLLIVQASNLGGSDINQTIILFDLNKPGRAFIRNTNDGGRTWSKWNDTRSVGIREPDVPSDNVNTYLEPGNYFVEKIKNGPPSSTNCNAFIFVYRKNKTSPYIYQFAYLTECGGGSGKLFVRYSRDGGTNWVSSKYTGWYELTDFLNKALTNPTAVLNYAHGGTGRTDGTTWQSDLALKTYYAPSGCGSQCPTQVSCSCDTDTTKLFPCPEDFASKCPYDGVAPAPTLCSCKGYCACNRECPCNVECSCNSYTPPSCSCDSYKPPSCTCNTETPVVETPEIDEYIEEYDIEYYYVVHQIFMYKPKSGETYPPANLTTNQKKKISLDPSELGNYIGTVISPASISSGGSTSGGFKFTTAHLPSIINGSLMGITAYGGSEVTSGVSLSLTKKSDNSYAKFYGSSGYTGNAGGVKRPESVPDSEWLINHVNVVYSGKKGGVTASVLIENGGSTPMYMATFDRTPTERKLGELLIYYKSSNKIDINGYSLTVDTGVRFHQRYPSFELPTVNNRCMNISATDVGSRCFIHPCLYKIDCKVV